MNTEEKIIDTVATIYKELDIIEVPIGCESIIISLGYKLIPYSSLSNSKQRACIRISGDAFISGSSIYYNDVELHHRVRFSLMHELGHAILGHRSGSPEEEHEADTFASWMLCPRVDLCLCERLTTTELSDRYDISLSAAGYVLRDYPDWRRRASESPYAAEKALFEQLSISEKKAAIEEDKAYERCVLMERSERRPIIYLEPFIYKSSTLKGQLREYAKRIKYLKNLAERFDLELPELLLEQQRVNYYYSYAH